MSSRVKREKAKHRTNMIRNKRAENVANGIPSKKEAENIQRNEALMARIKKNMFG